MVDAAPTSTVIGHSIVVSGNLQGEEDLTVLGRVDGSLSLTKTLIVEEPGIVKAEVSVEHAIINGVVVGNITASDSVQITETGRMVGNIEAPRVIIVDGARFRGEVDMGELDAPRPSAPLPARTTERTALARPTRTVAVPPRRPPPPRAGVQEPRKPAVAPQVAKEETAAPLPKRPPLASKKKIKKKVVVKKKG